MYRVLHRAARRGIFSSSLPVVAALRQSEPLPLQKLSNFHRGSVSKQLRYEFRCWSSSAAAPPDVSAYYNAPQPEETHDYIMQQTMIRVADVQRSLDFYTKILGMTLLYHSDFPEWNFAVYFVEFYPQQDQQCVLINPQNIGYADPTEVPSEPEDKRHFAMNTPGTVELTYNYGESGYHTGNSYDGVKGGFGHIGITIPGSSIYQACDRFHEMGVEFKKSPNSGGMKGLAFVKDPDGYWIEILPQGKEWATQQTDCLGIDVDGGGEYAGGGSEEK